MQTMAWMSGQTLIFLGLVIGGVLLAYFTRSKKRVKEEAPKNGDRPRSFDEALDGYDPRN